MPGRLLRGSIVACALVGALAPASASAQRAADSTHADSTHADSTHADTTARYTLFPRGHVFLPLVADPQEAQFRNSYLTVHSAGELSTSIAVTQPGGTIPLVRRRGRRDGDGLQLSIEASVIAAFDMSSDHWDLLNADYEFSYPISYRRGATSARFRFFHVSSHIGDEYLFFRTRRPEFTESFRKEAIDLLVARDLGRWRVYGGGEHAYSVAPHDAGTMQVRGGVEYARPGGSLQSFARSRFVAALHVNSTEERDWAPGVSLRTGIELVPVRNAERGGHRYRALLEAYRGPAPFGQFARFDDVRYVGIGCYVVP